MRFLRSPKLRAALYYSADGRCQNCGVELPADWHADHVIPYRTSGHTNLFEMQALCPPCNLRKGSKMLTSENPLSQINLGEEEIRQGQRAAITMIVQRVYDVVSGRKPFDEESQHTAIVLPTRYGKTDVIRASAALLYGSGMISNALILAPYTLIRDQTVDVDKLVECQKRFGLPKDAFLRVTHIDSSSISKQPWLRSHQLMAMTTHLAMEHIGPLTEWVRHMQRTTGLRPLVAFDECHMTSTENRWGETLGHLASAGAFIVLVTATAFRTDGKPIPGFPLDRIDVSPVTVHYANVAERKVHIYGASRIRYQLRPHHETTFQQAWAEIPSPICSLDRQPFEIEGDDVDGGTVELRSGIKLSQLSVEAGRRALMPSLKSRVVIQKACKKLVEELHLARRVEGAGNLAAIVFVGDDDRQNDPLANKHAEDVVKEIKQIDSNLRCRIAMSNNDGTATVTDFASGNGDILIVKQMASVGMDVARLKICLDLSNTRTPAAFIQRITRIATVWYHRPDAPEPYDAIRSALYICPEEPRGAALWNIFVHDAGGQSTFLEDFQYQGTKEMSDQEQKSASVFIPTDVIPDSKLEDTHGGQAEGWLVDPVNKFLEVTGLGGAITKTRIAEGLLGVGIQMPSENNDKGNENTESKDSIPEKPRNTAKEFDDAVTEASKKANQLASKRFREIMGRPYRNARQDGDLYQSIITDVWVEHEKRVGILGFKKIREFTDIEEVRRVQHSIQEELDNGR